MSGLKSGQVGVREWPLVERVAEQAQDGRLLCEWQVLDRALDCGHQCLRDHAGVLAVNELEVQVPTCILLKLWTYEQLQSDLLT